MAIYAEDSGTVAHDVRAWCLEHGQHPLLRIVLCGYGDAHDELLSQGWRKVAWKATKGYAGVNTDNLNNTRERLWLSPACVEPAQMALL